MSTCTEPGVLGMIAIVALICASGVFVVTSVAGLMGLATTLVSLVLAGASVPEISAAIATQLGMAAGSLEMLGGLVTGIKQILGC